MVLRKNYIYIYILINKFKIWQIQSGQQNKYVKIKRQQDGTGFYLKEKQDQEPGQLSEETEKWSRTSGGGGGGDSDNCFDDGDDYFSDGGEYFGDGDDCFGDGEDYFGDSEKYFGDGDDCF